MIVRIIPGGGKRKEGAVGIRRKLVCGLLPFKNDADKGESR